MTSSPNPAGPMDPAALGEAMPFARRCGVTVVQAGPAEVVAELPWSATRCTAGGSLHGGALMTLADSAAAIAAFLNLPAGAATSTVSSSTVFLAPVRSGTARATARPLHVGRRVIAVGVDLHLGEQLVGRCTQTQAVLPPSHTSNKETNDDR